MKSNTVVVVPTGEVGGGVTGDTVFCALAESGAATMAPKAVLAATKLPMTKLCGVKFCCFPFIVQKPVVNPLMF